MKQILISTAIALAIMLLPSAVRAAELTTENKLTNLTWCFHRSKVAPMNVETSARCNNLFAQMQSHFGDKFKEAVNQHAQDMNELLDALPVGEMNRQTIINIMYAKRTEI